MWMQKISLNSLEMKNELFLKFMDKKQNICKKKTTFVLNQVKILCIESRKLIQHKSGNFIGPKIH